MIITYQKTYRESVKGIDWQLFSCTSILKDTVIIHTLEKIVINNPQLTFEEMFTSLKENYKHKTCKSRCDIYKDDKRIEVIVKGVFPKFYIQKTIIT